MPAYVVAEAEFKRMGAFWGIVNLAFPEIAYKMPCPASGGIWGFGCCLHMEPP